MNTMNLKTIPLICSLLLTIGLVGCGKAAPRVEIAEPQQTVGAEASHEASPTEGETVEPEKSLKEKVLFAYQEILKAAPAIEGEHAELEDASFGYEENLERFGTHYELFALCDINQDDIPELIAQSVVNFRWTPVHVYTYADGETVLLKDPLDTAAHGTFEQNSSANGAYITYICGENHIHSVWRGNTPIGEVEENSAYTLERTSLSAVDCTAGESENTVYFYDIAKTNTAENVDAIL